jgi:uncharacterized protein with GYD domain
MRYVLLGQLSAEWATKQKQRVAKAKAKAKELKIRIESVNYTQGQYDFVDLVSAPGPEAVLAFSVWYAKSGLGRLTTLPAFDDDTMQKAVRKAG